MKQRPPPQEVSDKREHTAKSLLITINTVNTVNTVITHYCQYCQYSLQLCAPNNLEGSPSREISLFVISVNPKYLHST